MRMLSPLAPRISLPRKYIGGAFGRRHSPRERRPRDLKPGPSLGVDRLLALVVAAMRADAVRLLRLLAVGAVRERRGRQEVVRAPLVAAGLAVAPFWVGQRGPTLSSQDEGLPSPRRRPRPRSR